MNINETGVYHFSANSTYDTYYFIYENNFDVFRVTKNLLKTNYRIFYNSKSEWSFSIELYANRTYILVVTTAYARLEVIFVTRVIGINSITFNKISRLFSFISRVK